MRQKSLLLLGAVTVAVAAVAGYVAYDRQASVRSDIAGGAPLFPGLMPKVNDVAQLTIGDAKQGFAIQRQSDDRWTVKEKGGYPASADQVKKLVVGIAETKSLEPRTSNAELYVRMGLDNIDKAGSEAVRVALSDAKGVELATLLVGKTAKAETTTRPAQLYVRKPNEAQSWLAEGRIEVKVDPMAWIDRKMFKVERDRVMSFEVRQASGETIAVSRADAKSETYDAVGLPKDAKLKVTNANGMMAGLEALIFDDVAKAGDVDMKDAATATVRTFDGLIVTVRTAQRDGKSWATFEAAFDQAQADRQNVPEKDAGALLTRDKVRKEVEDLNRQLAGWAYVIPDYRAENFVRKVDDMVLKDAS